MAKLNKEEALVAGIIMLFILGVIGFVLGLATLGLID